jgi:hypothetical protein
VRADAFEDPLAVVFDYAPVGGYRELSCGEDLCVSCALGTEVGGGHRARRGRFVVQCEAGEAKRSPEEAVDEQLVASIGGASCDAAAVDWGRAETLHCARGVGRADRDLHLVCEAATRGCESGSECDAV